MTKTNSNLIRFLSADVPPAAPPGKQAIELDADVLQSLNAIHKAMGGRKAKRRIVNDVLRAAFGSDDLGGAFDLARETTP